MKKRTWRRWLSGMVVLAAALAGVSARAPAEEKGRPRVNHAVTANNDFALDLYGQLARANDGKPLFFSPYSVSGALTMVAEGARDGTADEMGKVLRFPQAVRHSGADAGLLPWDVSPIHASLAALNRRFDRASRYELRVANALWGEKTYPFKQSYLDTIGKHYRPGGAFPVDFRNDHEGARKRINTWVENQTKKRIKDVIPQGKLDEMTRLVVTNAIYFKGEWADPFSERATKDQPFTLADGAKVETPTMQGRRSSGYAAFAKDGTYFNTPTEAPEAGTDAKLLYPDGNGFEMLELPYKGGELSMVVIVPRSADGLPGVEKMLTAANLRGWIGKLRQRGVQIFLPKFKLETSFNLNKPLAALGMKRAFLDPRRKDGAQFDGMTDSKDPLEKLYIAKVLHKAFVEVSEKGAEAAAATAVIIVTPKGVTPGPRRFIPTFKADRAFVFLIRDQQTGTVLFLGRVMNPKARG